MEWLILYAVVALVVIAAVLRKWHEDSERARAAGLE